MHTSIYLEETEKKRKIEVNYDRIMMPRIIVCKAAQCSIPDIDYELMRGVVLQLKSSYVNLSHNIRFMFDRIVITKQKIYLSKSPHNSIARSVCKTSGRKRKFLGAYELLDNTHVKVGIMRGKCTGIISKVNLSFLENNQSFSDLTYSRQVLIT